MRTLGDLEARVMDVLWDNGAMTVRQVLDTVATDRPLAYTTIMTVLDHLHSKGMVKRETVGRAFRYESSSTRAEHTARSLHELLEGSPDTQAVLQHFVDGVSEVEFQTLRVATRRSQRSPRSKRRA